MPTFSIAPQILLKSLWSYRKLLYMLTKQEVLRRYRGSILGFLWSVLNPLAMLAIYTFVFSVVFKARWGGSSSDSRAEFSLALFIGLLIFNLFAECLNRAPNLIVSHVNYVKKVIFPLEILPWVIFFSALFQFIIGFGTWLLFFTVLRGVPQWSVLLLFTILLPLLGFAIGVTYFLSAISVYVRDISQIVVLLATVLMFLSPIFYPISVLPARYQLIVYCNPLTLLLEQSRALLLGGQYPNLPGLVATTGYSLVVLWLGFSCFQKFRRGFSDVL